MSNFYCPFYFLAETCMTALSYLHPRCYRHALKRGNATVEVLYIFFSLYSLFFIIHFVSYLHPRRDRHALKRGQQRPRRGQHARRRGGGQRRTSLTEEKTNDKKQNIKKKKMSNHSEVFQHHAFKNKT